MMDKHFDIETVSRNGVNIGYRVRSGHIYGLLQDAPEGWLIGRRKARTIEFEPKIYKTRGDAARALTSEAVA